jgi:DNA-binding IclR family transcriptional regulator
VSLTVYLFRFTEKVAAMRNIDERVLRLLGMTQRPLKSGELASALGLISTEARGACQSLIEHGYVTKRGVRLRARDAMATWALSSKGRSWAREQGVLVS